MASANTESLRHQFWTQLLKRSKAETSPFTHISPSRDSWIGAGAGASGIKYNYVIHKHAAFIELDIDCGDRDTNEAIFDALAARRNEIERDLGAGLLWIRDDARRRTKIRCHVMSHGLRDESQWATIQEAMVDAMIRFDRVLRPHILQVGR